MMARETMRRRRDTLARKLDELRAIEEERRQEYQRFCANTVSLPPMEKVTAWLHYIAAHRERDSDLEALVFLASRGHDISDSVTSSVRVRRLLVGCEVGLGTVCLVLSVWALWGFKSIAQRTGVSVRATIPERTMDMAIVRPNWR